jgi:monoamine oxidase
MRAVVIGGGFGGLASAAFLDKKGYDVVLVEKGCRLGGRSASVEVGGYKAEIGPTWYLMDDGGGLPIHPSRDGAGILHQRSRVAQAQDKARHHPTKRAQHRDASATRRGKIFKTPITFNPSGP